MKILFAASEAHPLIKTGGLADVAGSLPIALSEMGHDVKLVIPAYQSVLSLPNLETVADFKVQGYQHEIRLLKTQLPGSKVTVYLVDSPENFDRPGMPYTTPDGYDWLDNANRFATFCKVIAQIAMDRVNHHWVPDVIHCNDWQTGLVPALLVNEDHRPATVFTIHNLAYQGLYSHDVFHSLNLPYDLWSMHALEYHGQFSFIKGGIVFADQITTVSPTYAREIRTFSFGHGLHELLRQRASDITGILNGVDYDIWNPETDRYIPANYTLSTIADKQKNKVALQQAFQLPINKNTPIISFIGRFAEQKGIDLILHALHDCLNMPIQMIILGTGEKHYENEMSDQQSHFKDKLKVNVGYDEKLAHLIQSGSDILLMPSHFEPCGLNQLYSLKYGTIPVARRTGGLADTITETNARNFIHKTATGFLFDDPTKASLLSAIQKALHYYHAIDKWQQLMKTAMQQDYSWDISAQEYVDIYEQALVKSKSHRV